MAKASIAVILLLLGGIAAPCAAQNGILISETVETILRNRSPVEGKTGQVEQSYILIEVDNPLAILVLFAGGGGKLGLADSKLDITSNNFLVRSRHLFAASRGGFDVVVPDAASDILTLDTGLRGLRRSQAHLSDIAAIIEDVRSKVPGGAHLPLCLVGTSRGVISGAAYAATQALVAAAPPIACLVLTAPVTVSSSPPNESLYDIALANITVPTLLVAHWRDHCFVTPPQRIKELGTALTGAPEIDFRIFFGGTTPLSAACGALSPHVFFGIEPWVARVVGNWISMQVH